MSDDNTQILNALFPSNEPQKEPTGDLTSLVNVDELLLVVDRSGSMRSILADAEGGINSFIDEQKVDGEANITLYEFDDKVDEVYSRIPVTAAPEYALRPRGYTALFDAIGKALSTYREVETTGKKIAVIVTDGEENHSTEWNEDSIKTLIDEFKEDGWEFVFLAADEKAIRSSTRWGMNLDTSMVVDRTQAGSQNFAYSAASAYTTSLRSGKSKDAAIEDMDNMIKDVSSVKKLSS